MKPDPGFTATMEDLSYPDDKITIELGEVFELHVGDITKVNPARGYGMLS